MMIEIVDTIMRPQFIVTLLAAVSAFATVLTIALPILSRDRMNQRMKVMAIERDKMRASRLAEMNAKDGKTKLRQAPKGFMQQIVDQFDLRQKFDTEEVRNKLKMAGLRGQAPLVAYMFFRLAMPVIVFFGTLFYMFVMSKAVYPPIIKVMMAVGAGFAGFYLPNLFIENLAQKRQTLIKRAFPDSLDMLLICVQSGMSVEAAFGKVDVLVNNAGIQHVSPIEDFPVEKWDAIIALNLSASFHTIRAAIRGMKARRYGRIINIASAHAHVASPFKSAYVAAKHGLLGITKTVALEGATFNVRCNAIAPGYVHTPLVENQIPDTMKARGMTREQVINDVLLAAQPTKEFVKSDDIAGLALFLLSDAANQINGASLNIDGGWTAQ